MPVSVQAHNMPQADAAAPVTRPMAGQKGRVFRKETKSTAVSIRGIRTRAIRNKKQSRPETGGFALIKKDPGRIRYPGASEISGGRCLKQRPFETSLCPCPGLFFPQLPADFIQRETKRFQFLQTLNLRQDFRRIQRVIRRCPPRRFQKPHVRPVPQC